MALVAKTLDAIANGLGNLTSWSGDFTSAENEVTLVTAAAGKTGLVCGLSCGATSTATLTFRSKTGSTVNQIMAVEVAAGNPFPIGPPLFIGLEGDTITVQTDTNITSLNITTQQGPGPIHIGRDY